jgi:hypothetical protein
VNLIRKYIPPKKKPDQKLITIFSLETKQLDIASQESTLLVLPRVVRQIPLYFE